MVSANDLLPYVSVYMKLSDIHVCLKDNLASRTGQLQTPAYGRNRIVEPSSDHHIYNKI